MPLVMGTDSEIHCACLRELVVKLVEYTLGNGD